LYIDGSSVGEAAGKGKEEVTPPGETRCRCAGHTGPRPVTQIDTNLAARAARETTGGGAKRTQLSDFRRVNGREEIEYPSVTGISPQIVRNRLDPFAYLANVLSEFVTRAAGTNHSELLPDVWAKGYGSSEHRAGM
jgi:hypothetical protein